MADVWHRLYGNDVYLDRHQRLLTIRHYLAGNHLSSWSWVGKDQISIAHLIVPPYLISVIIQNRFQSKGISAWAVIKAQRTLGAKSAGTLIPCFSSHLAPFVTVTICCNDLHNTHSILVTFKSIFHLETLDGVSFSVVPLVYLYISMIKF